MPSSVLASQSVQVPMGPMSVSSVQPVRHRSPPSSDESSTVQRDYFISSFIYYDDIEVPYCVKVPCKKLPSPPAFTGGITLAVFKEHLPKRGNYRFFFKTECAEVHTKCVQEEITDDMQVNYFALITLFPIVLSIPNSNYELNDNHEYSQITGASIVRRENYCTFTNGCWSIQHGRGISTRKNIKY